MKSIAKQKFKTLDRADLVSMLSKNLGCSKPQAQQTLNIFINTIEEGILKHDRIKLVGFGILEKKTRKERKGRNPRTGEAMMIPKTTTLSFTAGKPLLERINKN